MDVKVYSTREFADLVNRKVSTLYDWAYTGKLVPKKDFNGRNIYTQEDFEKVMGMPVEAN